MTSNNRHKTIIRTGVIGIITNVALIIGKIVAGLLANSIALVIDAMNSASDVLSSTVTIITTKLSHRAPDKNHPMGHGRYEYMGTLIVGVIITYMGAMGCYGAIGRIITPEPVEYSILTTCVVLFAIISKIFLGTYTSRQGKKVGSDTLKASGKDALFDALISTGTLLAIAIDFFAHVNIEPYIALAIAGFIVFSGIMILKEICSTLIGSRGDADLSKKIRDSIARVSEVEGAFDLILHDYGPENKMASVNIEVTESMTAPQIDALTRKIRRKIFKEYNVVMEAVGIYSIDTKDDETRELYHRLQAELQDYEHILQLHGFNYDKKSQRMSFDIVIDFAVRDRQGYYKNIMRDLKKTFKDYQLEVALDTDYSG